ncbi:MAG: hypothetical protein L6R00_12335 [Phycisphaerae bacterium]|nr:hypothetical protein [Phycisphaerae bacterium]
METTWGNIIRDRVKCSGRTLLDVSRESGVGYGRVYEFIIYGRGVKLDNAERIARAVGLELRPTKRAKSKGR